MNEETLFHEALARATPAERAAFLAEACAGRPELRSAVEALLAAHEQSGEFLGPPAVPAADTADLAGSTDADDRPAAPATVDSDAPAASPDPAADLPR